MPLVKFTREIKDLNLFGPNSSNVEAKTINSNLHRLERSVTKEVEKLVLEVEISLMILLFMGKI